MAGTPNNLDWTKLMEEALTAPGHLSDVYTRFHQYSTANQLLFRMQGLYEPVASYSRWKQLGRRVIEGSKKKEVIVPLMVNVHGEETTTSQESTSDRRKQVARLIGFKVVKGVFGLSDTEGPALPETETPGWDLELAMDKLGIRAVPFESTNGNLQGYSKGVEFAVNPVAANPTKTRFHEMSHIILGHTLEHGYEEYRTHRGIMEFQAEAAAYIVMNELGAMDGEMASASRGYIHHWLDSEQPPDRAIQQVFTVADRILKAGRQFPPMEAE